MNLSALLREKAEKYPEKICIKFESRKISFSRLDCLVAQAANGLKKIGLKRRDPVAILMENCPEYIILYFAVIRAGGIVIPLNTFLTPDEITYILEDSCCKVLICNGDFSKYIETMSKKIANLKAMSFDELPQNMTESSEDSEDEYPDDEVAVFLYTSGTTGFPKGAMLSHKNLISNAEACQKCMSLSYKDRILLFLPLFHSFSFTVCVILPIYAGACIVLLKSVKPFSKIIKSVFRDRITFFVAVPTVYNILSRKKMPLLISYLFRFLVNIRACISGAAALPENTIREFEERFNLPLLEGYGLTEASPAVAVNPLNGVRKITSVGPPLPGIEVKVLGENGQEMLADETGELVIRGANVMKGYFNKEEETASVLKKGWLYTGDLARIDKDGYIYIVDRKKDLIIIDGMNVYPREVEELVNKHPAVDECAMVGVPDGRGSEVSLLFIKRKEDVSVDEQEIRNHMKGHLAPFKSPRRIIFLDELPKTSTGKIKKTELREWKI